MWQYTWHILVYRDMPFDPAYIYVTLYVTLERDSVIYRVIVRSFFSTLKNKVSKCEIQRFVFISPIVFTYPVLYQWLKNVL